MKTEFSNRQLRDMIVPLFFEQLLVMLVGIADTFFISQVGGGAKVIRSNGKDIG